MEFYSGRKREPLEDGETITIGNSQFVVAPCRVRQWKKLSNSRKALTEHEVMTEPWYDAATSIVAVALQVNYPEMTGALVEDNMLPSQLVAALTAITRVNEVKEVAGAEHVDPQQSQSKTGTSSSPESAVLLDGPGSTLKMN